MPRLTIPETYRAGLSKLAVAIDEVSFVGMKILPSLPSRKRRMLAMISARHYCPIVYNGFCGGDLSGVNAMSDQELKEFIEDMRRLRLEWRASPEKARQLLMEEGLITETGELTEPYR